MPSVVSKPVVAELGKEASESLPEWVKYAAIGGAALATIGVAYVLFGPNEEKAKKSKKAKKKGAADSTEAGPAKNKTKVEMEDLPEDDEETLPRDPLERAVGAKNKGNKYFRGGKYDQAIKCYSDAIELCPKEKKTDLSTFYQNRAAAYDQLEDYEAVLSDCGKALELNSKYVKALDRRCKVNRKQALKEGTEYQTAVNKLKQSLLDITSVCILEGFQKQEHLMMVDTILKELGRVEAKEAVKTRKPTMTSKHFINQYFQSFAEDPIMQSLAADNEGEEKKDIASLSGYSRALECLRQEKYDQIISACTEELSTTNGASSGDGHTSRATESLLLRGTFYILTKQMSQAFEDLGNVIDNEDASAKLRVNALIKRASLFIQQCKDPQKDPEMSLADFKKAEMLDSENTDIYHHRGQVHLLIEQVDAAIQDFDKAVKLNPTFPIAYVQKLYTDYRKASMEGNSEKVNNIINLFEQAVQKFPTCVESYALFAQVLSDQQNFERADKLYQDAQNVDPTNANLLVHRGLIQLQWRGDVDKAVELIRKGLVVDDKCEFAYETLGTIEVQRGNLTASVELFDKAIPLANTELEMAHLYGLREAAIAQTTVSKELGIQLPSMGAGPMM